MKGFIIPSLIDSSMEMVLLFLSKMLCSILIDDVIFCRRAACLISLHQEGILLSCLNCIVENTKFNPINCCFMSLVRKMKCFLSVHALALIMRRLVVFTDVKDVIICV